MTVMVGGDAETLARYRPLLEAMAGNIFHLGDNGAGCITKLVTQYLGYSNFITAVEGLIIGAKAGVDVGLLSQVVPVSAGASRVFDNIPRSVLSGTFISGGTLDIVAKDLHLACELAGDVDAAASIGSIADDVFRRAQELGWARTVSPRPPAFWKKLPGWSCGPRRPINPPLISSRTPGGDKSPSDNQVGHFPSFPRRRESTTWYNGLPLSRE